ncbi:MAG: hypothetical protein RMK61_08555 [Bacteroidota bacterium]|nr:hypothetical protein [Bacteroidota bacterium]MDW8138474.1 hypothetical protein [Bacteroidota bacterium]
MSRVGLLLVLLLGCRPTESQRGLEVATEEPPTQEAEEVWLQLSVRGQMRLSLWAARLLVYERPDSTVMILRGGVRARLFEGQSGPLQAELEAQEGTYWPRARRIAFQGDVRLRVADRQLWTSVLELEEGEERIRSPGFVRIQTPEEWLEGYGLEAAFDLSWYRVRRVTGRVAVPDVGT